MMLLGYDEQEYGMISTGELDSNTNNLRGIFCNFTVAAGYSLYYNIAAWVPHNTTYVAVAFNEDTNSTVLYYIQPVQCSISTMSLGTTTVPIDMWFDDVSNNLYFLYTTNGTNQCDESFGPTGPTTPRLLSATVATVQYLSITPYSTLTFPSCVRLYPISTWDSAHSKYIFYAQHYFGKGMGDYNNTVGSAIIQGSSSTASITGYLGGGADSAITALTWFIRQ